MKFILLLVTLCLPVIGFTSLLEVVPSPVDHLFVPKGFDNNDNVEVVVTGKYPNPCFIRNRHSVKIQADKILVTVSALQRNEGTDCGTMTVPFSETITIGNLKAGEYQVSVNSGTRFEQKERLEVATSRSIDIDNHLYAIVEYVELGFTGGASGSAWIMARSPSDCMVFDRVEYLSNGKDTLSILPIMKKISDNCNENSKRFEIPIRYNPRSFSHKDLLLFIRSIEGKAIHSIINK